MGLIYPWLNQSISVDVMGEKHLPRGWISFLEAVFPSAGVELILLMVFFPQNQAFEASAFS